MYIDILYIDVSICFVSSFKNYDVDAFDLSMLFTFFLASWHPAICRQPPSGHHRGCSPVRWTAQKPEETKRKSQKEPFERTDTMSQVICPNDSQGSF